VRHRRFLNRSIICLRSINGGNLVERNLIKFGKFADDVAVVGVSVCILY